MDFSQELPAGCPPPDARLLDADLVVFRLVDTIPPTPSDFEPHWEKYPLKRPAYQKNRDECKTKALSVFSERNAAHEQLRLPQLQGKQVQQITLPSGSGRILLNQATKHISWWVAKGVDMGQFCK